MITPDEFKRMPALLHRSQVEACGFDYDKIDDLRHVVTESGEQVPVGRIGAILGLGRDRGRAGKGYFMYLKWTIARLLGPQYE